jgi:hypothetical protein
VKLVGAEKLIRQVQAVPQEVRTAVSAAIRKGTEETANIARTLAPNKTGETKSMIFTKYADDGMSASVEAAPNTQADQVKTRSIEFGRKRGNKGTTEPHPYIRRAQAHTAKKFKAAVKRAMNKALKEATSG